MASTEIATAIKPAHDYTLPADPRIALRRRNTLLCLILFLLTLAFYSPVLHNGFTNLDDEVYVLHNTYVRAGLTWDTLKYAFTSFDAGNWHPLTWLSHALDCQLFNLNPAGHHSVNVLIHAGNAILLFLLLESATGLSWPSLMVAALFAFHPVNVESVAWASERKNVLSMFFFLLALHAYGWYVRRESVKRYAVVAGLFALGLMAKPEIITLPFVLLLWDYWPLRRMFGAASVKDRQGAPLPRSFSFLALEKVPLLLLSAASAVVTILAQRSSDAVRTGVSRARFGNAVVAYVRYLGKAFWPTRLAVMYPYQGHSLSTWSIVASALVLLLLTALVLTCRSRRYLAVGWFWFLGTLVPVIGIVEVGMQAMADRYAYLPYIGLFIAAVWGIAEWAQERRIPVVYLGAPAVLVLVTLGMLSHRQVSYWYDGETLWRHTLSVTGRNPMAHDGLAYALTEKGRVDDAIAEFNAVEALHGYSAAAMIDVGNYEQSHGHVQDALQQYKRSLEASSDARSRAVALRSLGAALLQLGDLQDAKLGYAYALKENPNDSVALTGSGLLAERDGDFASAVIQFARAIKVEPTDVRYLLLAQALRRDGKLAEADEAYAYAQRNSRDLAQAQQAAAQLLASAGIQAN
ncbi:MAG: hypothetical protein WB919_06155 [Candidatus Sulfotelmatobacter sp.]